MHDGQIWIAVGANSWNENYGSANALLVIDNSLYVASDSGGCNFIFN